jgi:hypothetical protein
MADSRCEDLLRISGAAFERFRPYRSLNQDIAENFYPMRADFTRTLNLDEFAGSLMDSTGVQARETLGNAIEAMLRQGDWFSVRTGNDETDKRPGNMVSLNRASSALRASVYHPRSNFGGATKEADMDWVSFGAFDMSIEASADMTHLIHKAHHLRDCAWLLNSDGRVDTHYRNMRMSARDIMGFVRRGKFNGTVAPAILEAERLDPAKEFTLRHILMPTEDIYGGSREDLRRIRHPYNSIYIDVENRTYLGERGAPVFNHVVGRHRTLGDLPFGFSPMAVNTLADARMLQDMALVIIEQGQKAVDPPTIGSGSVFVRDMNFFSGGHTEVDLEPEQKLQDVFTTLQTGNIGAGLELKQDVRTLIADGWLLNKLTLPGLRDMRELEVQVRTDEFRRAALPFFQPIEPNYHGEVLGTHFDMALHMGLIRPDVFNAELRGKELVFGYSSPLNEAEGLEVVRKYYEAINIVAAGSEIDPTVKTIFDLRQSAEDALSRGTVPEWLIPESERQRADEQANVMSGLAQGADIARQAAGVTADVANAQMAATQAGLVPA